MRVRENNQRKYLVFSRKTDGGGNHCSVEINDERCDIENITLKLFGQLYIDGEKHSFPVTLSRLRWAFLSRNEVKIYFARLKNNEIIHESMVVPQCRKFPFLRKGDFEIGPCYTAEKYRGHGIYPTVLLHIVESVAGGGRYSSLDVGISQEYFVDSRDKESGVQTVRNGLENRIQKVPNETKRQVMREDK